MAKPKNTTQYEVLVEDTVVNGCLKGETFTVDNDNPSIAVEPLVVNGIIRAITDKEVTD